MPHKTTYKSAPTKEKNSPSGTVQVPAEETQKIEAVIYAMAEKFLEKMDLEEVMEEISMTRLGEMLVNKGYDSGYDSGYGTGYDTGHSKGVEEGKLTAARNLLGSVSPDVLAKALDLPLETILKLKEEKDSTSK